VGKSRLKISVSSKYFYSFADTSDSAEVLSGNNISITLGMTEKSLGVLPSVQAVQCLWKSRSLRHEDFDIELLLKKKNIDIH